MSARDELVEALRDAEVHDRKLRGELVTARGRVGMLERRIAEHERATNALKMRIANLDNERGREG